MKAPDKPFVVQVYTHGRIKVVKVVANATSAFALKDDYRRAVRYAQAATARDKLIRTVRIEQVLAADTLVPTKNNLRLRASWPTRKVFMLEMDNEGENGGKTPSTLGSAHVRLTRLGLAYEEREGFTQDQLRKVLNELADLIRWFGEDYLLCDIINQSDWDRRAREREKQISKRHKELARQRQRAMKAVWEEEERRNKRQSP